MPAVPLKLPDRRSTGNLAASIRVIEIDGEPWFVAADVLYALGIGRKSHSYAVMPLDADQRMLYQIQQGVRSMNLISESGLYKIIMRSD